jgi:hypothetical protein
MGNCKKKCPLKASRFTDEYTLGYCDGIEQGEKLEMNEQGYLKSVQKIGIVTTIIAFIVMVVGIIVTIL